MKRHSIPYHLAQIPDVKNDSDLPKASHMVLALLEPRVPRPWGGAFPSTPDYPKRVTAGQPGHSGALFGPCDVLKNELVAQI